MKNFARSLTLSALAVGLLISPAVATENWHWRGPNQNGHFEQETGLPESWSKEGENLRWHAPFGSRSAPLVRGDKVYLINRAGEGESLQERIMALDLNTGKVAWEHRFNAFLTDIVSVRLGWANLCIDEVTGNVFGHGVQGRFFCIAPDGKILWHRSLTEEIGRISGYGGRTNTPIIDGENVIMSSLTSGWGPHGKGLHRFWAMNKNTGDITWWSQPSGKPLDTTYATPVIHELDGVRTLFTGLADGSVVSLNPRSGAKNWSYLLSKRGINSSIVYGDGKVYAMHSEENIGSGDMGKVVCLDARTGQELWAAAGITAGYASPILDHKEQLLYVSANHGNLVCMDLANKGKVLWEFNYGKEAKGSPVLADGKIYVCEVRGKFHILKVSREKCERLNEVEFIKASGAPEECFGTPTVAHGKVLVPTIDNLYCISLKDAAFRHAPQAPKPVKPAQAAARSAVALVPAETWIAPGEKIDFTVLALDAQGHTGAPIPDAVLSVKGLKGAVDGLAFTADAANTPQAGMVTATVGELSSTARLRVVPKVPFTEDFETYAPNSAPPGWITSPLKAKVIERDGGKVLLKTAERPSPPFARLRCYMSPPLDTGYTVQSDMLGIPKKRGSRQSMPDMGLINARYLLQMIGGRKTTLRLTSWAAIPRVQKDIDFEWKADTWYTVKLSVDLADGKAKVRGKVWPKGEAEPNAWTIEVEDGTPNEAGSPGLYAYSRSITSTKGTEVLFDNVAVTPNK